MESALRLPVLFLPDQVVLPGMVVPLELDDSARSAIDTARAHADERLIVAPRLADRYPSYGVEARVVQLGRTASGTPAAVVRAEQRVKIGSGVAGDGSGLWVEATPVAEEEVDEAITALADEYRSLAIALLQRRDAWQVIDTVNRVSDPSALADLSGYTSWIDDTRKRELLETPAVAERLRLLIEWTRDHLAEIEVNDTIAGEVREQMEKSQREYLLRQQLAAIRTELGEDEPEGAQDYRTRVEEAELPDHVRTAALREVGKLERASDQNPEAGWIRTWLDTVLDLPWSVRTTDSTDLVEARRVLDDDHHGLTDVKERIVEHLAVRARRASRGLEVVGGRGSGAVLALAGPPGVGKTSLGESIARALGRTFVRVALGGVRDEAEIRGHRRTYVGALPGRIVRAISEAGSMNPVVLLDEIDKVGSDFRGDPSAALLEVLDPAQNHTFVDHYLDVDLDLSDVLFLATANVVENIPQALLDRMELITVDGYTADDKRAIARNFLLPRQLERTALDADEVSITDEALDELIANHTREPGVRQLERLLGKALRKVATQLPTEASGELSGEDQSAVEPVVIDVADLPDIIGRARFTPESRDGFSVPGVATGLAVTGFGGDVLSVEAATTDGKPGLTLTGQLGDVMKESAQIALSYVRAHAEEFGIADRSVLEGNLHVHVPAGAVPKDGPSAGVTMVTAIVSMALGVPVRPEVGMTGEVTLNGRVLPIGGVKQKLLAAQRAGLTEVFVPQRNEPDLDEVPSDILESVTVRPMTDVAELVRAALGLDADQAETSAAA